MAVEEEEFKALQKQVLESIGVDIMSNRVVNSLIDRVVILEKKSEADRKRIEYLEEIVVNRVIK